MCCESGDVAEATVAAEAAEGLPDGAGASKGHDLGESGPDRGVGRVRVGRCLVGERLAGVRWAFGFLSI